MIEVDGLAKHFGAVHAVRDVSFRAPDGAITALLGPNGAGKTTTLRMIATLVAPSHGRARVDGIDCVADPVAVRARLGVLSDARGLYARLTARENIRYYGELRGMDYLQTLSQQRIVNIEASSRAILDQVIAGEYPLGLMMFNLIVMRMISIT